MGRKRVTGRFYVFLVLLLVGAYFILRELLPDATSEAVVTLANATYSRSVDAVIVRDEAVTAYEGNGRVVYVASEGQSVLADTEVCDVYAAGYSEKEMNKLETVRQNIRAYHITILDNIVDTELDRLENGVQSAAQELKTLIGQKAVGSLLNLEAKLESAMQARQEYLRQNRREDPKLNQLYEEEKKRENAISSWKTVEKAGRPGIVSFYLDGCEEFLTPDNLGKITLSDAKMILSGRKPELSAKSRLLTRIFRVVSTDKWYIILVSDDADWNPVTGQSFTFQLEGYGDVAYSGTVVQMQKSGNEVMAQLEVAGSPGPLINKRYGRASIGVYLSGLSVPVGAVANLNGQTGVYVSDAAGGSFIPVTVLSSDSRYALVQALVEGSLYVGQRVLVS